MLTKEDKEKIIDIIMSQKDLALKLQGSIDGEVIHNNASIELAQMIANREKYRWHDLRKNPDDLPAYHHRVEVATWDKDTHEIGDNYFTSYGMHNPFSDKPINMWIPPYQYFSYGKEIIAWREIEPFEEGE